LINNKEIYKKEQNMLKLFKENNLVISSDQQKNMAKKIISSLNVSEVPERSNVRYSFSKIKIPLSEEVLRMRG